MRNDRKQGVIAVLPADDRVLMVRRAVYLPKGGCWCFPGGHVEPGESLHEAIRREMLEELGVHVTAARRLGALEVPDSGHELTVFLTQCDRLTIRPAPAEIGDVRWVSPADILSVEPGLPSNALVVGMLPENLAISGL